MFIFWKGARGGHVFELLLAPTENHVWKMKLGAYNGRIGSLVEENLEDLLIALFF